MTRAGFSPFKPRGTYLVSQLEEGQATGDLLGDFRAQIGQVRVSFEYDKCGTATVMAEQCYSLNGSFSFSEWTGHAKSDELTRDADGKRQQIDEESIFSGGLFCICFACICLGNYFDDSGTQDVINHTEEGERSKEEFFAEKESKNLW